MISFSATEELLDISAKVNVVECSSEEEAWSKAELIDIIHQKLGIGDLSEDNSQVNYDDSSEEDESDSDISDVDEEGLSHTQVSNASPTLYNAQHNRVQCLVINNN